MSIHHIKMDDGGPASNGSQDVIRQMREVGGENRRCKFDQNMGFPRSGDSLNFNNRFLASAGILRICGRAMRTKSEALGADFLRGECL
jgi:hypothetical protein